MDSVYTLSKFYFRYLHSTQVCKVHNEFLAAESICPNQSMNMGGTQTVDPNHGPKPWTQTTQKQPTLDPNRGPKPWTQTVDPNRNFSIF